MEHCRRPRSAKESQRRKTVGASLSTPLRSGSRARWRPAHKFDDPNCPVPGDKCLVGDAPNVGLGDVLDAVDGAEQFAPVVITRLIQAERKCQALIRPERADEVRLGAP